MCFTRRNNRGQTLIEAAFVLPILFLLTFAIIEFGWYFWAANSVSNASREGARIAVVTPDLKENDPQVTEAVKKYLQQGTSLSMDNLVVTNNAAANGGDLVKVTVQLPYVWATPLPNMIVHTESPPVLMRESEMRYEGSPQQAREVTTNRFLQRRPAGGGRLGRNLTGAARE